METHKRLEFKTIVVATDFTDTASSALRYAKAIALRHRSVLVVVHVIDPVGYAFPEGIPNSAAADQAAREELRKIEEETRQHRIPIHSVVETGIVFERILQAVEDHHGDLLVLGTRAKTGIGRAALGAVARRLLAKAECPVLTVPPDSEAHLPWAGHWRRVLVATDFSAASLSALAHAQRIAYEQLMVLHAADITTADDCKNAPSRSIVSEQNSKLPQYHIRFAESFANGISEPQRLVLTLGGFLAGVYRSQDHRELRTDMLG